MLLKKLASFCMLAMGVICLGWFASCWFAWKLERYANPDFKARLVGGRIELRWEKYRSLWRSPSWVGSREIPNAGDLQWGWWHWETGSVPPGSSGWIFSCAGFEFARYHNFRTGGLNGSAEIYKIYLPLIWPLIGLAIGLPWSVRTLRRSSLNVSGKCSACGYDLRATPTRCPECGQAPQSSADKKGPGPFLSTFLFVPSSRK